MIDTAKKSSSSVLARFHLLMEPYFSRNTCKKRGKENLVPLRLVLKGQNPPPGGIVCFLPQAPAAFNPEQFPQFRSPPLEAGEALYSPPPAGGSVGPRCKASLRPQGKNSHLFPTSFLGSRSG